MLLSRVWREIEYTDVKVSPNGGAKTGGEITGGQITEITKYLMLSQRAELHRVQIVSGRKAIYRSFQ